MNRVKFVSKISPLKRIKYAKHCTALWSNAIGRAREIFTHLGMLDFQLCQFVLEKIFLIWVYLVIKFNVTYKALLKKQDPTILE